MNIRYYTLTLLLLTGCAAGPDFKSPDTPAVDQYTHVDLTATVEEQPQLVMQDNIPDQWWQLFESQTLTELVEKGLSKSPTLAAAEAKLRAAQETLSADTGTLLYPTIDLPLSSSRQKISGATFGNAGNPSVFTVNNASIAVSYDISLLGAGQRYIEASQAQVDFVSYQLEAARQTLATNIVTTALTEASLREQLTAMNAIIEDETDVLNVIEKQFAIGVIPKADLLNQRSALAQARAQLPALQKALAQSRNQLAVLTGDFPTSNDTLPRIQLDALTMPGQLPITLPSTLTQRRPDVRAAEELLHQANAQVGVATANLYPRLTLSANYSTEASVFGDLFSAGTAVWGLAAGLTQPLFHGGELRAKKRAAIANFDQAAAQYRQSVLIAFQDVANALLALNTDSKQLNLQKEVELLATETLVLVREQYKQGAVSYLNLLTAQRNFQQARINLIRARVALYNDTAALMYALGGNWDIQHSNTTDQTTEKTS